MADEELNETVETTDAPEPVEAPSAEPESSEVGADTEVVPLSSDLLSRAERDYGLKAEDVAGFDTDRLERMFATVDRRTMAPQPDATQQPVAPQSAAPQPESGYKPFELDFGEDIDESLSGPMKGFVGHFNEQMKELHAFRGALVAEVNAINQLRDVADFDRHISSLGDEWSGEYGKGSTMDLDPNGKEFQARLTVYNGGLGLLDSAQRGGQKMSRNDGWLRSHRAVHWDKIGELARKKLNGKVEGRERQFGERPSTVGRKKSAMTPREEAIAAFEQ